MTVATRSSMNRSWVTSTSPPSNAARLSSSTSSVGMSRSLVGSSRISRSAGSRISRAMWMRACSPPESRPTGTSRCSGGNRKRLAHAATCTLRPWKTTASPSGASARRSGRSGSSHARCCSKRTVRSPSARSIVPASGSSAPASRLSSVVLPLPFGPMRPTRMPGVMIRSSPRISTRPPEGLGRARGRRAARGCAGRRRRSRCRRSGWPPRARASRSSSMSRSASLMRPFALVERALAPAPEPLDLAPHRVGERLLVGGLAPEELVATDEELAVAAVGLEEAGGVRPVDLEHAGGHVLEEVAVVAHHQARPRAARPAAPRARGCRRRPGGWWARPSGGRRARRPARGRWRDASASPRRARPPRRGRPRSRPGPARARCGRGDRPRRSRPARRRARPRRCRPAGRTGSCGTYPTRTPPRSERRPRSGDSRPARIFRRVDLPAPFGPTRPTWSPSKSPKDSPSKRDRVP